MCCGEGDRKGTALFGRAVHCYLAAVGFDDRFGDGQAETGFPVVLARAIAAIEAVKDVGQVFCGDAVAIIFNLQQGITVGRNGR